MKLVTSILALGASFVMAASAFAAEGAEAAGGGSWLTLLLYIVNAAIFVAICVYFAGPGVRQFFAQRARTIRERRGRAEADFAAAEQAAHDAARQLEQLAAEKARLLEEMEAETAYQIKTIRETALAGAARIGRDAELTAAAAVEEARRRVRSYLAGVAGVIARELVQQNFNADDQRRMLAGFAEKLTLEARP
jgi:F0F1-type ATP synthase membrane subunit b/b'